MLTRLRHGQPLVVLCAVILLLLPVIAAARIGVGVGVGKIRIDEPLKAGGIYDLPSLPVLNTGDEPANYGASIEYHEGQETRADMGQRPPVEWFQFEPESFRLEPGEVQSVKITLRLPAKLQPGNYFAYLEGHPVQESVSWQTSIGIAAATKLYFTVEPSNIVQGMYYSVISLYSRYHPWDTVILAVVFAGIGLQLLGRRFKVQIARK